ncbi:MAG: cytochrome c oxidase accessory protein CcoG [Marinicaulis sp.]|nr:cytochrome c oxidase accessory protein CcoG [Marinicaulis sp.]
MNEAASKSTSGNDALTGGVERLDVEPVNKPEKRNLYKARDPIYPKRVRGAYRRLKWVIMVLTLGVYYLVPWIRWPRGPSEPDQAVLIDFPGSRFYFFFIEIWPDELYYVTGLLILAALGLFLATALFGRIWCGYSCPQTVWTDLYIAVERMVEGDRNQRIKLDRAPWSATKLRKKATKHALWILIGMATGGAWILYFHDAPSLARDFFVGRAPFSAYFYFTLLTFTTYVFAGSMREQVCTYMCPWPRIQAALTDADTLQVTYRKDRGEPRGAHKKGDPWDGRGDCVSCRACVAACPMGIDIRDGLQLECINCALCIDACDSIMEKVGRPRGLIAYDTDANIASRAYGGASSYRFVRPRVFLYLGALVLVSAIMLFSFTSRATMNLSVQRDRAPPFVLLSDGAVRNAYTIKITNRDNVPRDFILTFTADADFAVGGVGDGVINNAMNITIDGDETRPLRLFLTLPRDEIAAARLPVKVTARDETGIEASVGTVFLSEAK